MGTNSYGLSAGQFEAVILIHELGHAFADIYGAASTTITSDGSDPSGAASAANTAQVVNACFTPQS